MLLPLPLLNVTPGALLWQQSKFWVPKGAALVTEDHHILLL